MLSKYRIEKRLPFGFTGQWGLLFKPFDYDMVDVDNEKITYNKRDYVEIGMSLQLKRLDDMEAKAKIGLGSSASSNKIAVETTDAYLDDDSLSA